jgi:hypothetical protein
MRSHAARQANRRGSRPPAVASAMSQLPMTRGDTGGLTRPISMGPAAPMGPLPPGGGGYGAAPKVNPLRKPFPRGQQGIGGNSQGYDGEKWIGKAIKHKGALHRELGVPEGEKIPKAKIAAAASKGGKLGKRARLAETLGKMHKG